MAQCQYANAFIKVRCWKMWPSRLQKRELNSTKEMVNLLLYTARHPKSSKNEIFVLYWPGRLHFIWICKYSVCVCRKASAPLGTRSVRVADTLLCINKAQPLLTHLLLFSLESRWCWIFILSYARTFIFVCIKSLFLVHGRFPLQPTLAPVCLIYLIAAVCRPRKTESFPKAYH